MKPLPGKPYRFYRPRRPGGLGEGLKLEGVTTKFGLLGIAVLMLVGMAMLGMNKVPEEHDLIPVIADLSASPYRSGKSSQGILIPFSDARVMKLDGSSLAAVDTISLFSLQKGDTLEVYMQEKEAENWKAGVARKDFYTAIILKKAGAEGWVIDYHSFRKEASRSGSQGWWLLLLGAILIPYQLIRQPKIPIWLSIALYVFAIIVCYLL